MTQKYCDEDSIAASLSTSPVAVNGTSTLTVQVASSVAPGIYSVTVNGMSGSQAGQNNHSISIPVTVTGGGGTPDFTLSANPASVTVAAPGSGTTTITVNPVNGFTGSVALSAAGLPSGVTAGFSPTSTTGTSVLTFTTFWKIYKMVNDPKFLAIITIPQIDGWTVGDVTAIEYSIHLRAFLESLRSRQEPGMSYAVFTIANKEYVRRSQARMIYRWLGGNTPGNNLSSGSVHYFYLGGHGWRPVGERVTNHGVEIGANITLKNYRERNSSWQTMTIPLISRPGQYQFVWLDCCHTVGGNATNSPPDPWGTFMTRYPNLQWQSAFKITGNLYDGAFMGDNGQDYFSNAYSTNAGYAWYQWRLNFWSALSVGDTVLEAITYADLHPRGSGHPTPLDVWSIGGYDFAKLVVSGEYKW